MTKKKRAQKRKQATAAAARKNTNNETPPTVISKENTPSIQTEKGATAMFADPKSVWSKRVIPPENMSARNVDDSDDDKNTEDSKQYPLPTKICSSVPALQPQGTSCPADELMLLRLMYLDWIYKKMMESGFIMHEPYDLDLMAFHECSNSSNSVVIDIDVAEDQRTLAHKEDPAVEKNQDLVIPNSMAVATNQEITMQIEENAQDKYQEAAISEELVNDIEKNILEAFEHGKEFVAVHDDEEAVTATRPAADRLYPTHDAVSAQVVTPEVLKQLQTIREIIQDVLNRVTAEDAQL